MLSRLLLPSFSVLGVATGCLTYCESQYTIQETDSIWIKNSRKLEKKIENFRKAPSNKILLIADFDATLTKYWVNGKKGFSCHRVAENCTSLPNWYKKRAYELWAKYYPVEIDPKVSFSDKVKSMQEWVTKAHGIMATTTLTLRDIEQSVKDSPIELR